MKLFIFSNLFRVVVDTVHTPGTQGIVITTGKLRNHYDTWAYISAKWHYEQYVLWSQKKELKVKRNVYARNWNGVILVSCFFQYKAREQDFLTITTSKVGSRIILMHEGSMRHPGEEASSHSHS